MGNVGNIVSGSIAYYDPEIFNAALYVNVHERVTLGAVLQSSRQGSKTPQYTTIQETIAGVPVFEPTTVLSGIIDDESIRTSFGPLVQVGLLDETASRPSVGVGGYGLLWGDDKAEEVYAVHLNASKGFRAPIVEGIRFDAGVGYMWRRSYGPVGIADNELRFDYEDDDGWQGWFGASVEVIKDVSIFGVLATVPGCDAALTFGVRWRTPIGIDVSIGIYECLDSTLSPLFVGDEMMQPCPGFCPNSGVGSVTPAYAPAASPAPTPGHSWGD